jgi:hypothetical protein
LALLVGVLALEIGSALAVVLCRAMGDTKCGVNAAFEPDQRFSARTFGVGVAPTPKRGRKPIGAVPLSNAEKCRRYRERRNSVTLN